MTNTSLRIAASARYLTATLSKLPARGTQLILIDCYIPEKTTGLHSYAHLILTVLTKDANSDLKVASAIILN